MCYLQRIPSIYQVFSFTKCSPFSDVLTYKWPEIVQYAILYMKCFLRFMVELCCIKSTNNIDEYEKNHQYISYSMSCPHAPNYRGGVLIKWESGLISNILEQDFMIPENGVPCLQYNVLVHSTQRGSCLQRHLYINLIISQKE